jgi:AcrR family transcriptional regulator
VIEGVTTEGAVAGQLSLGDQTLVICYELFPFSTKIHQPLKLRFYYYYFPAVTAGVWLFNVTILLYITILITLNICYPIVLNPVKAETMEKRGRPKLSESPTRQFILKGAKTLFRQHGFTKVSVEDICSKAGASKMSFYRHFRDKIHLALIIIEEFTSGEFFWFEQLLRADVPFIEKMNIVYKRRLDNAKKLGLTFLRELQEKENQEVKLLHKKISDETTRLNLQFLAQGQSLGIISPRITPKIFLFFIQKRNELIMDKELLKLCPQVDERITIVNDFFYYGMQNKPDL